MRTPVIVIVAPGIEKRLGVGDIHKAVHVQALVAQASARGRRSIIAPGKPRAGFWRRTGKKVA